MLIALRTTIRARRLFKSDNRDPRSEPERERRYRTGQRLTFTMVALPIGVPTMVLLPT
jgi:hypothetical protein